MGVEGRGGWVGGGGRGRGNLGERENVVNGKQRRKEGEVKKKEGGKEGVGR